MDSTVLAGKALSELREIASTLELRGYQRMKKADLVDLIVSAGGNGGSSGVSSPRTITRTRSAATAAVVEATEPSTAAVPADGGRDGADSADGGDAAEGDDGAPRARERASGQVRERHRDGEVRERTGGQGGQAVREVVERLHRA
jgi:hypothetical protein